jgi:ankyrin repeat protein
MGLEILPFRAELERYEQQAEALLAALPTDPAAARVFRHHHPRFLDAEFTWLPKNASDAEVRAAGLVRADAELAVARRYDFRDWPALVAHVREVVRDDSPVFLFESAIESVVDGDATALAALLGAHAELARACSSRVTHFDPPVHRATLLHYVAANGVESYRQRTPPNAVAIATMLLDAGADPDAEADMYGDLATPMTMLVSSTHPARAGVQVALVDVLVDRGAALEGRGGKPSATPLMTALAFGYGDAAARLVARGARVDQLAAAAGLGYVDEVRRMLPAADGPTRHMALALAAQLGRGDVVRVLLDAGEDPNRYNPKGLHGHATPMHQAVAAGHEDVVRLLVERGARLDMPDRIYESTPLGWAAHLQKSEIERFLRAQSSAR